jgi:hypothetical protein
MEEEEEMAVVLGGKAGRGVCRLSSEHVQTLKSFTLFFARCSDQWAMRLGDVAVCPQRA